MQVGYHEFQGTQVFVIGADHPMAPLVVVSGGAMVINPVAGAQILQFANHMVPEGTAVRLEPFVVLLEPLMKNLTIMEKTAVLYHELAHVKLGHLRDGRTEAEIQQHELEADQYAAKKVKSQEVMKSALRKLVVASRIAAIVINSMAIVKTIGELFHKKEIKERYKALS